MNFKCEIKNYPDIDNFVEVINDLILKVFEKLKKKMEIMPEIMLELNHWIVFGPCSKILGLLFPPRLFYYYINIILIIKVFLHLVTNIEAYFIKFSKCPIVC